MLERKINPVYYFGVLIQLRYSSCEYISWGLRQTSLMRHRAQEGTSCQKHMCPLDDGLVGGGGYVTELDNRKAY